MKRFLLILCFCQLFVTTLKASDSTLVAKKMVEDVNRSFYLNQLEAYKLIPANLWLWNNGDFSSISVNGRFDKGEFKQVQGFQQNEGLSFKSESVQSFPEEGWRFYGNFTFHLSDHQDASWNLGYKNSEIGNPFSLLTERNGNFNVKHYGLEGIINKKLGKKFSIGFGLNYRGDLYFRLSDTRNEYYNLKLEVAGAVDYKLADHQTLSIGSSYYYKKSSPEFSNEFKTSGSEYYLYFNEGLGDFNEIAMSQKFYLKDQHPKYFIGYRSGQQNTFSITYSAYPGNEHWDYKITSMLTDTDKELYKYEYFNNKLLSSFLIDKSNYKSYNSLEANYISGTGYKNRGEVFQKTYLYDGFNLKAESELLRPNADLFRLSSMNISFENIRKKDMVYAHQIEYTNIKAEIKTGYSFELNSANELVFDLEGAYKHNLSYTHDVVSAGSKPYTLNLAYNEVAYHTTSYYTIGGELKWFQQLDKMATELLISFRHLTPSNIKINNPYSFINKKEFRYFLNTSLNFYF